MSRENGYVVTIKAFVASPRNDFEKQAAAAVMMATITKSKTIPAEFLALASIEDVSAKYGSRLAPESVPAQTDADEYTHLASVTVTDPPAETQSDEAAVEGVRKAGRSRG